MAGSSAPAGPRGARGEHSARFWCKNDGISKHHRVPAEIISHGVWLYFRWRAVDQDGNILDILVQRRRDKKAARTFFRKLLKGLTSVPRVIVTDRLKSYATAKREIRLGVEHRQHRYLNNRAEHSHQPTRHRERRVQGFKSPGHAQRFLAACGLISSNFRPRRHRFPAPEYRQEIGNRFHTRQVVTGWQQRRKSHS